MFFVHKIIRKKLKSLINIFIRKAINKGLMMKNIIVKGMPCCIHVIYKEKTADMLSLLKLLVKRTTCYLRDHGLRFEWSRNQF